jgi:hypothetical protein
MICNNYVSSSQLRLVTLGSEYSPNLINNGTSTALSAMACAPNMGSIQLVSRSSRLVKRPGREADHSSPSSAEVKNAWIRLVVYFATPPMARLYLDECQQRNQDTILPYTWGKPWKPFNRIARIPTGIRTKHYLNSSIELYRCTNPLSKNVWRHTSTHAFVFITWGLIKHRKWIIHWT